MKETEQTLLDQIKDQVAIEHGYVHWLEIEDDHLEDVKNILWPIVCERYYQSKSQASCEATLKEKEKQLVYFIERLRTRLEYLRSTVAGNDISRIKKDVKEMESDNKALREENQRLKERIPDSPVKNLDV